MQHILRERERERERERPGEKRNKFIAVSSERVLNPLPHCGSSGKI
jgi:hypothetical protein